VLLGAVILGLYGSLTWFHRSLPLGVLLVGLAWCGAWWSSLQHELLHGHPFHNNHVNTGFGLISFTLWIPFDVYKASHLIHHRDEFLTDPYEDPESYYRNGPAWVAMPEWKKKIWWMNRTLLGRLTIGPFLSVGAFLANNARDVVANVPGKRRAWARHICVNVFVVAWVIAICRVPVWQYLVGGVWGATSLMKLRSFAEHRWEPDGLSRSAMVHAELPFGLLYLHNNLHYTHHARPGVAWYRLPKLSEELHSDDFAAGGAGVYRGYREVARKYMFRPFCIPVHPAAPEAAPTIAARLKQVERTARA
jgi:fatty acid desaturase